MVDVIFPDVTDEELDQIVMEVHHQFLQSGYRQILAILRSQGILVRESRTKRKSTKM